MRKKTKVHMSKENPRGKPDMLDLFLEDAYAYLRGIGFDKRVESEEVIPAADVKQLLRDNFNRYFRGEVDLKFIIGLAHIFDNLAVGIEGNIEGPEVEQILAVSCPLVDIESEIIKYGEIKKPPEEINRLIHQLFEKYLK
jgi:hypothetical protein